MAVNVSRYCTRTSVWNLCSQKWKVLQLRVLFRVFFFHKKRADRGCLICCDEMFSFCNTNLILTSAAPAAEEAGHAYAAGCRQPSWSSCSRLARAVQRMDFHHGYSSPGWWCLHWSQAPSTFTWPRKHALEQKSHSYFTHPTAPACCWSPLLHKCAGSQIWHTDSPLVRFPFDLL